MISARLARLMATGADAVQVACEAGVSLQRARTLIDEFQGARGPESVVSMERGGGRATSSRTEPAGGPSEAPPASANAGLAASPAAPTQGAAGAPDGSAVNPRVVTPLDPSPPARPFCRAGEDGPALPLSPAVLDALGIQLADRR